MSHNFFPDSGSKFFRVQLTRDDSTLAMEVSPLFLAFLQNKIEAYATALVDTVPSYNVDPAKQLKAIIETERLRNFCQAYEELLSELLDARTQNMDSATSR